MDAEYKKNLGIALFICVAFLLVFSIIPSYWHQTGDFNFHYERAAQRCPDGYEETDCQGYYPLLHWAGSYFSFSKLAFGNFLSILIVFITPMILFFLTRKWMTVWFYFAATQYVPLIQAGGAYPQALAGIFMLLFLLSKNPIIRFGLLIGSLIAHSQAFVLLLVVWFVQLAFENISLNKLKGVFPACSAIFGRTIDDPIGQTVNVAMVNKNGLIPINIILKDIANFFVRTFPLPFLIMALWQLKRDKEWSFIVLTVFVFYYGIATGQARIFLVAPLLLLPALTRFYYTLNPKWKRLVIAMSLVTFAINFGTWTLYKVQCVST